MSKLKSAFDAAVADSKTLDERPDNQTLLRIYGLFKQASEGDVTGKRPGFTDLVGLHYWFKRIGFDRQMLGTPERLRVEAARAQGLAPLAT